MQWWPPQSLVRKRRRCGPHLRAAQVGFPYDTSLMFFWEFYSMGMPMFAGRPDMPRHREFSSRLQGFNVHSCTSRVRFTLRCHFNCGTGEFLASTRGRTWSNPESSPKATAALADLSSGKVKRRKSRAHVIMQVTSKSFDVCILTFDKPSCKSGMS